MTNENININNFDIFVDDLDDIEAFEDEIDFLNDEDEDLVPAL